MNFTRQDKLITLLSLPKGVIQDVIMYNSSSIGLISSRKNRNQRCIVSTKIFFRLPVKEVRETFQKELTWVFCLNQSSQTFSSPLESINIIPLSLYPRIEHKTLRIIDLTPSQVKKYIPLMLTFLNINFTPVERIPKACIPSLLFKEYVTPNTSLKPLKRPC